VHIVLASASAGKLREIRALLEPRGHELLTQAELGIGSPPETGTTFLANALLKAYHASQSTGLASLADDSGLEVDALQGRPGVYSARYAGEKATDLENLEKLLEELQGIPAQERTARYRCVVVLVRHVGEPTPLTAEGVWEGRIATAPQGSNGFGYDPVFIPDGLTCTAAELTAAEKNELSHRAQALRALRSQLLAAGV
jgi:XTP/dITP diphosphohydrolase